MLAATESWGYRKPTCLVNGVAIGCDVFDSDDTRDACAAIDQYRNENLGEDTHKDPKANMKPRAILFRRLKFNPFNSKIGRSMIAKSSNILNPAPA